MKTGGLATAVALAGGVGDLGLDDGEQGALFEADAALPLEPVAPGKSGDKGGRPSGRRNNCTLETRNFFLSNFRSPLMGLGAMYSRSAEDLARQLFMTKTVSKLAPGQNSLETIMNAEGSVTGYLVWDLERAAAFQRDCMIAALPYVERKQPIAIDTAGAVAGIILIGEHAGVSDAGDGVLTLDLAADDQDQTIEEYQQVSEAADVRHADVQSHDAAKAQKQWGEFQE